MPLGKMAHLCDVFSKRKGNTKMIQTTLSAEAPRLPQVVPLLARVAFAFARTLPRGYGRLMRLGADHWPCMQNVVVDFNLCGPMCLDLRETVCHALLKYGCYPHQSALDRIVSAVVKPGMVVFDIGANIGWYTCLMHRLAQGRGLCVAVEPMPRALRLLRKCAESRPIVQVVPCAIGEASGYAQLCEAKSLDVSQVRFSGTGEVEVVTIDGLAARFGHPDVIKIDVEGAELMAFRGAAQALSSVRPPFIFFEYIQSNTAAFGSYTLLKLIETLKPGKYSIFRLGNDARMHAIDSLNEDGCLTSDYVAVPHGRLSEVSAFRAVEVN